MNEMLNSKLLGMLANVDKEKLDQVSNMIKNMPRQDLENIINMLGINKTQENTKTNIQDDNNSNN